MKIILTYMLALFAINSLYAKKKSMVRRQNVPMVDAGRQCQVDVLKLYLEGGANIDQADQDGQTALYACVSSMQPLVKKIEGAKFLIERKANINATFKKGLTPLSAAVHAGAPELVKMLLDAGADIDAKRDNGTTPLMVALDYEKYDIAKMLLAAKAKVNVKNNMGVTPMTIVASKKNKELADLLLKNGFIDTEPLHTAIYFGEVTKVNSILKEDAASLEKINGFRQSPLMLASELGDVTAVTGLLAAGAKMNQKDEVGQTPLIFAVLAKKPEIVHKLIAAKADVNMADMDGTTPLIWAVTQYSPEIVTILVKAKAKVNTKNKQGLTALGKAKMENYKDIINMLKKAGAKK